MASNLKEEIPTDETPSSPENKNPKSETSSVESQPGLRGTASQFLGAGYAPNPFDFSAMSGLHNDPSIKELAEQRLLKVIDTAGIKDDMNSKDFLGSYDSKTREAPQLAMVLKEMKDGLDLVRSKVQALTSKVKENNFPTADGISYLEAKHILLISYCQSIVYYLLQKTRGFSIEGHPVVGSLIEIRLFLEKIRPIDKKLEYQIQKLTRDAGRAAEQTGLKEKELGMMEKSEDLLQYRPNPDMLLTKDAPKTDDGDNVYRPPKIAPAIMQDDRMSKGKRDSRRREKQTLRQYGHGYMKELIDNLEGRPEEIMEDNGNESKEFENYRNQWEERARQEEELFTRIPLTKMEKRKQKQLQKSRNRLLSLADGFFDEFKTLPLGDDNGEQSTAFGNHSRVKGKQKKRKVFN